MPTNGRIDRTEGVSWTLIQGLAEARDVDPLDLTVPLNDVVDSEALDKLCASASPGDLEVRFRYDGQDVVVDSDGTVEIDGREYVY